MKHLFKRELSNYFNTPIGYVFGVACLFVNFALFFLGVWFIPDVFPSFWDARVASIRAYLNLLPVTYMLMVPAVSMRIWAEERKSGTIELISTLPLRDIELVLAKFLAAWVYVGLLVVASIPLALSIRILGSLDLGTTLALYLGSVLMAGAYVSAGMVISALTREQIVAFILTFFASVHVSGKLLHREPALEACGGPRHRVFLSQLPFYVLFPGLVDAGDVTYYISFIVLMLTVNVWILRSER